MLCGSEQPNYGTIDLSGHSFGQPHLQEMLEMFFAFGKKGTQLLHNVFLLQ